MTEGSEEPIGCQLCDKPVKARDLMAHYAESHPGVYSLCDTCELKEGPGTTKEGFTLVFGVCSMKLQYGCDRVFACPLYCPLCESKEVEE